MKLYVCWGTFQTPRPGGHPCANAHTALKEAGWEPEVIRTYGWGALPEFMNPTRRPVKELTDQIWVPVLVTDGGEVIQDSRRIIQWAKDNPAGASDAAARASDGPAGASDATSSS
jgi:Glutathione S-transferase, N-terminal domain